MYDILIDYTTGHSLHSERIREESSAILTTSLEAAEENLKRIKAHYEKYHDSANYGKKYELTVLTDEGEKTISPFWIGYFETLHGAKIVTDRTDMSFEL